jgi:hypothetical protein
VADQFQERNNSKIGLGSWKKCEDIGNESNCTKASSEERGRQKFQHPGWWSSGGSEQDSTVAEEHEGR